MTKRSLAMTLGMVAVLTLAISGCGRKGALDPAPDQDPAYPRPYPAEETHGAPDQSQPPRYETTGTATRSQDGPYRAYSNYPRPKQSTYPYSSK